MIVKDNIDTMKDILKSRDVEYDLRDKNFFIHFLGANDEKLFQIISMEKKSVAFYSGRLDTVDSDQVRDISQRLMRVNTGLVHGAYLVDHDIMRVVFKTTIYNDDGKLRRKDLCFHHELGIRMISKMDEYLENHEIPPLTFDSRVPGEPMYS